MGEIKVQVATGQEKWLTGAGIAKLYRSRGCVQIAGKYLPKKRAARDEAPSVPFESEPVCAYKLVMIKAVRQPIQSCGSYV
jgi:hypothetical protein